MISRDECVRLIQTYGRDTQAGTDVHMLLDALEECGLRLRSSRAHGGCHEDLMVEAAARAEAEAACVAMKASHEAHCEQMRETLLARLDDENAARADERAKIVAWLRKRAEGGIFGNRLMAADAIERGEHEKP